MLKFDNILQTIYTFRKSHQLSSVYVELSPTSTDTATLTLSTVISTSLLPATAQRIWDIQTSQIPCYAAYR